MERKLHGVIAIFAITLLSSCQAIGDIFKAGAYVGIFAVLIIAALIFWIVSKFRGRS